MMWPWMSEISTRSGPNRRLWNTHVHDANEAISTRSVGSSGPGTDCFVCIVDMCIPQPSIRAAPCRNLAHPWPHHIPLFTFGEVPGICGLVLFALECEGLRDCDDRCEIPTGSKSTLTVCRQYNNRANGKIAQEYFEV